jgi:lipopolysaccharide export system permease protein
MSHAGPQFCHHAVGPGEAREADATRRRNWWRSWPARIGTGPNQGCMTLTGTILSRYVFRQTAGAVLLILLSLTGVVWIALALRQLNLVTSQGQETWLFIKMTLLALPNLMALIAPVALLVASIHVLNRLNGDSELIVMTAGGGTVWAVARPLLLVALLVSLALAISNHLVLPWSLRTLRDYIIQVRTDLITQVIQPGRFSSPEPNLTFHIRDRARDGQLLGLVMHDAREQKQVSTFLAERGRIVKQDGAAYLLMEAGHILRRSDPKEPVRIIEFKRYAVDLARFEAKEQGPDLKPGERYHHELVHPDPKDEVAQKQPGLLRAEVHRRLSSPLYPFAFVLITVAFIGQARTTRQNRLMAVVAAFLISAGCRLGGLAGDNLVALRASAAWIVYAIPIGAMTIGLIAAQRGMRRRRRTRLELRLAAACASLAERTAAALARLRPRSRAASRMTSGR